MHRPAARTDTDAKILRRGDGRFALAGVVDFGNAGQLMEEGRRLFADQSSIVVDASAAEVSSTAGLAVMMEWAAWCETRDKEIIYEGVHPSALAVAAMNGVAMMLPVATGDGCCNRRDLLAEMLS